MSRYREGYYWVVYKDFNTPYVIELRFESWDHTNDGNRWVIWDGNAEISESDWYKYHFISYIDEPKWPYGEVEIKLND